jgi:hypothetical protein
MRTIVAVAIAAATTLALAPVPAGAQTREGWLKSPVLVFQPGIVLTNTIDAPDGVDGSTDLLLRLVTAVPTAIPRTTLVAAVQWAPTGADDDAGVAQNQPEFHYGPVFHLFDGDRLAVDLGVLGAFSPSATDEDIDERAYSHKLRLQGDLFVKLGRILVEGPPASRWERALERIALQLTLANAATGVDPDVTSRWTVQAGVSIPVAP